MTEYVEFNVRVLKETPLAVLVQTEQGNTQWVPKRAISEDSDIVPEGEQGQLLIEARFAEREGLE